MGPKLEIFLSWVCEATWAHVVPLCGHPGFCPGMGVSGIAGDVAGQVLMHQMVPESPTANQKPAEGTT